MKVLYYPGCSLRNTYPEFEKSTYEACEKLGIDLVEIPEWSCCGVVPSLATDNVMRHLGAIRSFVNAQEKGKEIGTNVTVTLCSMCYNVLKRVNLILKAEQDTLENVNNFIDDQPNYVPELRVVHFLTLLKETGFENLQEKVKKPLRGLKVASYYGCALLRPDRPEGVPIDSPDNPTILEAFVKSVGAEPVHFPFRAECCGNYHIVCKPDISEMRTGKIIGSAKSEGADLILSSCPLCTYNLGHRNERLDKNGQVPVVFLTQLLALALGVKSYLPTEIEDQIMKKIGGEKSD
jgi:heterodisulfide reductase subunit B